MSEVLGPAPKIKETPQMDSSQQLTLIVMGDSPLTDVDSIPKDSDRDPYGYKLHEGIDFRYQPCPYSNSPSRYPDGAPHTIPMSGLERDRLAENYYEILGNLSFVRDYYLEQTRDGEDRKEPLTIYDTREVLMALNYASAYLVYRSEYPVKGLGELPTDLIVMANAAAGSLAALGSYMLVQKGEGDEYLDQVPDPQQMIEESEKSGRLVGEKTVCAASPELMAHFFKAVIEGPTRTGEGSLPKFVDQSELSNLFAYGKAMYEGVGTINKLRVVDTEVYAMLNKLYASGRREEMYRVAESYLQHVSKEVTLMLINQAAANFALGRDYDYQDNVPLEDFEESLNLTTAKYIRNGGLNRPFVKVSSAKASDRRKKYLR